MAEINGGDPNGIVILQAEDQKYTVWRFDSKKIPFQTPGT